MVEQILFISGRCLVNLNIAVPKREILLMVPKTQNNNYIKITNGSD
jgi:hypothetical protein